MKLWEKRIDPREEKFSVGTWERREHPHVGEREVIFREGKIRFIFARHRNRGEGFAARFPREKRTVRFYSGRTERYSRTADCQSENRSFGTFPKVYACWFEAVQCTDIKGTTGHVFQGSLLKVEAVQ